MRLLAKVNKRILWVGLVVLFTIPAVWNLMKPGYFSMQDDLQAFRIQQMDKCFDDGQFPCRWVPDAGYGYGYPQFNFYPPSVYYIGALLHRIGIQYIDAVKILFLMGYIASALAMFLLVKSFLGSSWPAFISSILYTYAPYKAVEVYVRGAMSEFWSLTLFPLILWAIFMAVKREKRKYFIYFSIFTALLLLTHNLMTLIFTPVAAIWAVYWLYTEKKFAKLWLKVGWSGLLALGFASFFTLPVIFEQKYTHIDSILSGYFDYRQHFVSLYKLFISREWGYGSSGFPDEKLNLSVGLIQWLVGLLAVAFAVKNIKKSKKLSVLTLSLFTLSLFTLFMIHMKSSFIWVQLPFLWWLQFPWRFLSVSIFLLSILGGVAVYLSGKYKNILGSLVIILAIVLNIGFFVPKDWLNITDTDKFSGTSWQKQMTISIFDYLPIYAEFPPITEAPENPEIMDGEAIISEYYKGSNFQKGKFNVINDANIRLPLYDFPGMRVKVNGKAISHNHNDCRRQEFCYGLISFNLPVGEHLTEARLTNTPVRIVGNIISLTSLLILFLLLYKNRHEKVFK